MGWTHLSPFWKSTTEVGTKKPWQQVVAPMPVTSRCGLLKLACSMALYVLHVLGYFKHQLWSVENEVTYLTVFLATEKMCIECIWIGHKCHPSWKWSIYICPSRSHVFCWEVAIHDECTDELIVWEESILRLVSCKGSPVVCILSSNH